MLYHYIGGAAMDTDREISRVELPHAVTQICVGSFHSIAICEQGVWAWGRAESCNLGSSRSQEFVQNPQFLPVRVTHAHAGHGHTYAWNQNEVYCWGSNKDYQLGLQDPTAYQLTTSKIFAEAIEANLQLMHIACGDSHSLAAFRLEEDQEVSYQVFAWGESKNYQLALEAEGSVSEPIMIDFHHSVKSIHSRSDYNFIITQEGDCHSWGTNLFGRLGFANSIKNQKFPTRVPTLPKIAQVSMGKHHCIAIGLAGDAYSWGHGLHGQLGLDYYTSEVLPTRIELEFRVEQASCGEYHSLILAEGGELYSCGSNAYLALGHDEVDHKKRCKKFAPLHFKPSHKITKIASGYRHNLLLTENGQVFSWGCNKHGQLARSRVENSKQSTVRRELYRENNDMHFFKKSPEQAQKSYLDIVSPFSQLKSELNGESRVNESVAEGRTATVLDKIAQWKQKYDRFKKEQEMQQKQLLQELEQLLRHKF